MYHQMLSLYYMLILMASLNAMHVFFLKKLMDQRSGFTLPLLIETKRDMLFFRKRTFFFFFLGDKLNCEAHLLKSQVHLRKSFL